MTSTTVAAPERPAVPTNLSEQIAFHSEQIAFHRGERARLLQLQRDEDDDRFLEAIFQTAGSAVCDASDLFAAARLHPPLAVVLQDETWNSLGRRLMRLTNRTSGRFTVQFIKRTRRGRVYAIVPRHLDTRLENRMRAD